MVFGHFTNQLEMYVTTLCHMAKLLVEVTNMSLIKRCDNVGLHWWTTVSTSTCN